MELPRVKRMLNAGSGRGTALRIARDASVWEEVRIDIDPDANPNLLGSIADMRAIVESSSFNAVWCSHCLEHLDDHEVLPALQEFRRILTDDGFAIVSCPNLDAVARQLASEDVESVAYISPAGPIRLLDMIFGHGASIKAGAGHMAHRTGFTAERLGRLAIKAGFAETRVREGDNYDLWAALMTPGADADAIGRLLQDGHLRALFPDPSSPPAAPDAPRRKRVRILRP